jgi:hypothetical protein
LFLANIIIRTFLAGIERIGNCNWVLGGFQFAVY